MRFLILIIIWVTPAIIAGALGWRGIWGGSSAFFDYLIPVPVAGGVFHVPSFLVVIFLLINLKKFPESIAIFIPVIAFAVFVFAQTMQVDFDKLNDWFFTDYAPSRSPIRFGKNPFYLFVASDALCISIYAWTLVRKIAWKSALLLPLIPLGMIGFHAANSSIQQEQLSYGFSMDISPRGNRVTYVYANAAFDEKKFRDWLDKTPQIHLPWERSDSEHLAVYFSKSMQSIKYGKLDDFENIVGTICYFEEDQSSSAHTGHHDCFVDRLTLADRLNESFNSTNTGLGKDVDRWYGLARVCEGIDIPEQYIADIELPNFCRSIKRDLPDLIEKLISEHGEDSERVRFVRSKAVLFGLLENN